MWLVPASTFIENCSGGLASSTLFTTTLVLSALHIHDHLFEISSIKLVCYGACRQDEYPDEGAGQDEYPDDDPNAWKFHVFFYHELELPEGLDGLFLHA